MKTQFYAQKKSLFPRLSQKNCSSAIEIEMDGMGMGMGNEEINNGL